jgi:DNA-binding NarL/FixJ family response regulator
LRILLADDHPLVLIGIQRALESDPDFEIVGTTRHGAKVLPLVGQLHPDVVLLDVRMPSLDGIGCLQRLRARYPEVKVVMLSMFAEPDQVRAAFDCGASGYVVKSIDPAQLGAAVRRAIEGAGAAPLGLPVVHEQDVASSAGLTDREITIVKALARGLSNHAIAAELWVTEQTVKFHLTNVYRKLGVRNRTEAVRWAFANGFVEELPPLVPTAGARR